MAHKTKFVTCIYSNLFGTEFGGRPSRDFHYKASLLSLLKIPNSEFVVYTAPETRNELEDFFYTRSKISPDKLKIKAFNLHDSRYFDSIRAKKDLGKMRKADRCYEVQYNKFYWLESELDDQHNYFYWIDAGLSYNGLIHTKYLVDDNTHNRYYNSTIFNELFLSNLQSKTSDKIYVIGKDNTKGNYWSPTVPPKYYDNYNKDIHIIGGLFGGVKNNMIQYCKLFDKYLANMLNKEPNLYYEELLMSLIYQNHLDDFVMDYFEIWPPDASVGQWPAGHVKYNEKSFFEILISDKI